MNKKFEEIDKVLVNKEIMEVKFTCDLTKCNGACCTLESSYGAPITKEEIELININLAVIKEYIPKRSIEIIEKDGFWDSDEDLLMTKSVDNHDCVFVYFDNSIAKCGIEKAYFDKKITFRKPLSCHLFPIRINKFGGDVLKFERYHECVPALITGLETNLSIYEFCKDALIRQYGQKWYNLLEKKARG
ncbi:MAG: DUF3109 family protein [bacterium]